MNTASLELCKRLYELTGWDDPKILGAIKASETTGEIATLPPGKNFYYGKRIPAYDLGYLLRKLPASRRKEVGTARLKFRYYYLDITAGHSTGGWVAGYRAVARDKYERIYFDSAIADTPEDALCQLAITLFEKGILKEES